MRINILIPLIRNKFNTSDFLTDPHNYPRNSIIIRYEGADCKNKNYAESSLLSESSDVRAAT
jgi:hypothetical protein